MDRRVIEFAARYVAPATGALFFALVLRAPEPRLGAEAPTASEIKQFYIENEAGFRGSLLVVGLAYACFLAFVAVLRTQLRRAERGDGTLSALATGAAFLVAGFYVLGTALRAVPGLEVVTADTDPAQAETLRGFAEEAYDTLVEVSTFWRGVMLAAIALVVLRYGGLPRWLGWAAAALAVGALVGPAIGWFEWPLEPVGFVLGYGSFIVFHFWILAASVVLTLRARSASVSA